MLGCFVNKTDASRTVNIVREHLHETILHGRTIICKLWRRLYARAYLRGGGGGGSGGSGGITSSHIFWG